ncbi:hypothetical protein Q648_01089 [Bartonella quintana JK 12]|uniref:Uncharacterized protein n=2 Tax=Bartonella quintana TaxID=803 RepID=W3TZB1_BARQI|nr:hypothetical protein Q651_00682 [Bartonella quintana BQ2-D70]ETS14841.1 hypothetical protein Q650_00229 [Bartonella quintana JK 73rel]ETS16681.1 hypothetical protein Q649_00238 [Bartonella quintana JK 73]ETS16928.1 hypothetical protein Q648_01089 [Bartonella quintana JK 12]ETS19222.1 hypothetical protein Q647_00231 [Bartonella quintana JK 7]KEC62046.1 hypothetical protein O91_00664 [Bartonella quintana JK 31]KEC63112.1 hypothetical protein O7Y_00252 [Bartonella quintana JK 63]KEC65362.1 h
MKSVLTVSNVARTASMDNACIKNEWLRRACKIGLGSATPVVLMIMRLSCLRCPV